MQVRLIASLLAGAWRETPPSPEISVTQLTNVAPLLIASGGGALAFWKLRGTELEKTAAAEELKQAYRLYTLQAAIHEREIEGVIKLLRQAGVDPILVKGWSVARHFPEPALRPYGDIDLFVRPDEFSVAKDVLQSPDGRKYFVDLHEGSAHLDDQPLDDLYARSKILELGRERVRVLSDEDHLRVLCVHFLQHGAWRPAALCDIGLMVEESQSGNFDWELCLTNNQRRAKWITCTVGLAHHLLGANIKDSPIAERALQLPRWLVPAVLKEWENPVSINHVVPPPLSKRLKHPLETLRAIRKRWPPNPVQATIDLNGPFNEWPRLIFQVGDYMQRTAKFLTGFVSNGDKH